MKIGSRGKESGGGGGGGNGGGDGRTMAASGQLNILTAAETAAGALRADQSALGDRRRGGRTSGAGAGSTRTGTSLYRPSVRARQQKGLVRGPRAA